jgi:hypothetical protein
MSSVSDTVYNAASEYGKIRSIIGGVIATIIGVIAISVGVYLIQQKDNYDSSIIANVVDASCVAVTTYDSKNKPITQYDCNVSVSYKVNNKDYTKSLQIKQNNQIVKNSNLEIEYVSSNPEDIRVKQFKSKYLGSGSIVIAILVIGVAWLVVYFTQKSKTFSAATGALGFASDTSGVIKNIFRK